MEGRIRTLSAALLLGVSGCKGWLDVEPPGQVFDLVGFEDVTARLGAPRYGPTFGMGWGDVNGDGMPDLWSGNHADEPSLYINQGDGTFTEEILLRTPFDFELVYDAHGVAWIDLDNDGDADLVESVGAQQGEGLGRNRVLQNTGGTLLDVATTNGLGHGSASGRCPIPLDWNQDGLTDVMLVSQPKDDGSFPSALFTQQADHSFVLEAESTPESAHPTALCGQLADLDGDWRAEIVAFGRPEHISVFRGAAGRIEDVSGELGLPLIPLYPFDVAIGDIDNDLDNDLYVARWNEISATQVKEREARLALRVNGDAQRIRFRTDGDLTISLDPVGFWSPDELRLGADCSVDPELDMRVMASPTSADLQGRCAITPGTSTGLFVGVEDGVVEVALASAVFNRGNVDIRSTAPLRDVELIDVPVHTEEEERQFGRDRLFIKDDGEWFDQGWNRGIQETTSCTSATLFDVDNDMDLDLFLVCATPVENVKDMLYLNENGRFVLTSGTGLDGPAEGRGDSAAVADFDGDGFVDVAVSNGYGAAPFNEGPLNLFRNTGNTNHWLHLDLSGTTSTRDAWGAVAVVRAGGVSQRREQSGGTHAMAQHYRRLYFGLGENLVVDQVEIHWPSGRVQILEDVEADQVLKVTEPLDPGAPVP
jgi:hypothetical protein